MVFINIIDETLFSRRGKERGGHRNPLIITLPAITLPSLVHFFHLFTLPSLCYQILPSAREGSDGLQNKQVNEAK